MTKVKICGITNVEDAMVAAGARADLLGFIFFKPSPRYVSPHEVRQIVRQVAACKEAEHALPLFVGVFVNESPETVLHNLDYCGLDAAQLHGDEPPAFVAGFAGRGYKALRPKSKQEAEKLVANYHLPINQTGRADVVQPSRKFAAHLPEFLLDAYHPNLYGGTGHVTDWDMAANIAGRHSIMLAGSLTPKNVAQAVLSVNPWGVDVSSGVERKKGKKDHQKVKDFIETVRKIETLTE